MYGSLRAALWPAEMSPPPWMLTAMPGEPVTVKQPPAFQKAPLAPAPDADADEEGLATQT